MFDDTSRLGECRAFGIAFVASYFVIAFVPSYFGIASDVSFHVENLIAVLQRIYCCKITVLLRHMCKYRLVTYVQFCCVTCAVLLRHMCSFVLKTCGFVAQFTCIANTVVSENAEVFWPLLR